MNKLLQVGTLGLASLTTTGLIAFTSPAALAGDDGDSSGNAIFKRDDSDGQVLTTVDNDDDDNSGPGSDTNTATNTNTGSNTRGDNTDHSRMKKVDDVTNDGPGNNNADKSRHHTNDASRHNTRG